MLKDSQQRKRQFLELYDAHGAALMALLRRLAHNPHDAEELFQESAVRVWSNLHKAPRLRNPRAWLMTVGYRVFVDHYARRKRAAAVVQPITCGFDRFSDSRPFPDQQAVRNDEAQRLHQVVASLSDGLREVVTLHYAGGLSLRETARAMDLPVGTVKSRLNQALHQLRRYWGDDTEESSL